VKIGRDQPFDAGWRFYRGAGDGYEAPAFPDGAWRQVDLPHDWSIEDVPGGAIPNQIGPFDKTSKGGTATGFTLGGEGWYRKHFSLGSIPADARIEILFDGVYLESDFWLNGHHLGSNLAGYRPFALDLSPYVERAGANVLAVRVRNLGQNSRWYSGSGLYRQVKLDVLPAGARIARWGVAAWTRRINGTVAEIDVSTRIDSPDPALQLVSRLRDSHGAVVAQATTSAASEVRQTLTVKAAQLWSPGSPSLYTLETELRRGPEIADQLKQHFGIRIITISADTGLKINGKHTALRGGCIHHDNGLLGACAFADADERRIRLLKARGFNAIRSSHNPASRTLREACDRMGMMMINEAFDVWHSPKLPEDFHRHFADHWEEVVEALVLSARNSPSVIMWSIGNEIPLRSSPAGIEWQWKLANKVRSLDPTRPVTEALNGLLGGPLSADEATARPGRAGQRDQASTIFLDVPGYNYRMENIVAEHADYPDRVVYASETFPHDAYDYQAMVERVPYFLGEFVWTAMDYLGEAGIGAAMPVKAGVPFAIPQWPFMNAACGDIDLIGQQKPASRMRDVVWGLSAIEMAVQRPLPEGKVEFTGNWAWTDELESWSWPDAVGKPLRIRLYSSGDRVAVMLNGREVGRKDLTIKDKQRAEFEVAYAPGVLEGIAYRNGAVIGRKQLTTAGAPARLLLSAEHPTTERGRQNLSYVGVKVLDAQGHLVPDSAVKLSLKINGPADLAGFGNANPLATGSFQANETSSYQGRALAVLRGRGMAGSVRVEARAPGLRGGSAFVRFV
jgi:beta-galactosidase